MKKRYKIKGTNMKGHIVQHGANGLVILKITKNYNPFMRQVFGMEELEEIKC
ncbi:hypothetical protein [Marinisporobacter balticus]|nr:hypothetical protein [Marinisporobacter balticus]